MAVKISELSASAQITSDDFLPIVDSGSLTTKRASAQQVLDYVTGSTFNSLTVTTLTGSTVTGSTALFTSVTASYSGSGAGLTDIPNSSLLNDSITVGSTGISLGGSTTTIQGLSVLTGSTVTGSTALFDNITASVALFTGDIRVLGTASIGQLNTVTQQSLIIGDKYITILSGGVDHTGINGAGFLWGTSSGPGETTGALGEHAHVLYDASRDALEIFPGLYVTGSTTVFGISGTTAQFTTLTGSTVTGTLAQFTTVSASTVQISGNLVIYGSASFSENPDYAYVLYTASYDKIVVYPGLYVSGNLTGSGLGAFQTVSASTYLGLPTSSGGTPGGTNTTIQFNSGSTFSGSSNLVWDYTNERLGIGTTSPTRFIEAVKNDNGTVGISVKNTADQANASAILEAVNSASNGFQLGVAAPLATNGGNRYSGGETFFQGNLASANFISMYRSDVTPNGNKLKFKIHESLGSTTTTALEIGHTASIFNPNSVVNYGLNVNANTIISGTLTVTGSIFVSGSSIYGQVAELTSSTSNYTLVRQDSGKFLNVNSGSAVTVTVPTGLPTGFTVSLCQLGAGQVTVSGAVGVTINNRQSHTKTAGQYSVVSLVGTSADTYVFVGDTSL